MSHISFVRLFSILTLTFGASALSASTISYAVGTCRPGLPSFPTILAALAAVPSANVIEVCPGIYDEQLEITHPVTLEGVSNGTSARAIITPPARGLVTNGTDEFGGPVAAQLWVNNASGPVNIGDLTVNGSGNKVPQEPCCTLVVGIFYKNSSGTVNRVATRNQSGNFLGIGIYAEGGFSNPSVTIENSSVRNYDDSGIQVDSNSLTPELTAVIKGNYVTTSNPNGLAGILTLVGSAVTVISNLVVNAGTEGIDAFGGSGSVSDNTVRNVNHDGIFVEEDGISVTSNKIFGSGNGIFLGFTSVATIQGNTITDSATGIEFHCNANPNVYSNVISDVGTALDQVPSAIASSNKYFNVDRIRAGGC